MCCKLKQLPLFRNTLYCVLEAEIAAIIQKHPVLCAVSCNSYHYSETPYTMCCKLKQLPLFRNTLYCVLETEIASIIQEHPVLCAGS